MNSASEKVLQAQVDSQLMEQGSFSLLELLFANGEIVYADYERWRLGELEFLDSALKGEPGPVIARLQAAVDYAGKIGLVEERQEFSSRQAGKVAKQLVVSDNQALDRLLGLCFVSGKTTPQLDMFFDSPRVVVRNGLVDALTCGSSVDAVRYLNKLCQLAPEHGDLPAFNHLCDALRRTIDPIESLPAELLALQKLQTDAARLLGAHYRDFMVPLWRRLSTALAYTPFSSATPDLHPSYTLAQTLDWQGVSQAILSEAEWWTHLQLCLRLAECGYLRQQRSQTLTAWFYLCWQFPVDTMPVLNGGQWKDRNIVDLWSRFLELDETLETEEFPAWLILAEPGLTHSLAEDLPGGDSEAEQLFKVAHQLACAHIAENRRREFELRKELQQRKPALIKFLLADIASKG